MLPTWSPSMTSHEGLAMGPGGPISSNQVKPSSGFLLTNVGADPIQIRANNCG